MSVIAENEVSKEVFIFTKGAPETMKELMVNIPVDFDAK